MPDSNDANGRADRIKQVIADYLRMRDTVPALSDTELVSVHAELMPDLAEELRKIRVIERSLRLAREGPEQPGETGMAALPRAFGRYEVRGYLGRGGFADVFVGHDEKMDCAVAIKVQRPDRVLAGGSMEQVLLEARRYSRLRHPGIVRVFDVGEQDGLCYIVSDLVEGPSLRDWLATHRPTWRQAVRIAAAVAEALAYAHSQGIVHRDVKPANVILTKDETPILVDLGLAFNLSDADTRLNAGKLVGTHGYMSPEQARGEGSIDGRSDIYSLGAVLYQMLTAQPPFGAGEITELLRQAVEDEPLRPRLVSAAIPPELARICLTAMAKQASDRYATASEFSRDLRDLIEPTPRATFRSRLIPWTAALAATVLMGFAVQRYAKHEQARTLVRSVITASPSEVSRAIAQLVRHRTGAIPMLHEIVRDDSAGFRHRLHAAFALASLGESDETVQTLLLDAIEHDCPADECQNLVAALEPARDAVMESLLTREEGQRNLVSRTRYATVLLHLGEPQAARRFLELHADPSVRTVFIHAFPTWHGDLKHVAESLHQVEDDAAFQSGLCTGLGFIAPDTVSHEERLSVVAALEKLFRSAPDGGTHSAAGWALSKWDAAVPKIEPQGPKDAHWFINSLGMTMIEMLPGEFTMGDADLSNTQPRREEVRQAFFMCDREVSDDLMELCVGDPDYPDVEKPKTWKKYRYNGSYESFRQGSDSAAQIVNWFDAVRFCNWLSARDGRQPSYRRSSENQRVKLGGKDMEWETWILDQKANGYRLPTEVEWEYACRAGTTTSYSFGENEALLSDEAMMLLSMYGFWAKNSPGRTQKVSPGGRKPPNAWGVFDMHGNVEEWCQDWFASDPHLDTGEATTRVLRGGSVLAQQDTDCRSGRRSQRRPDVPFPGIGFRVVTSKRE